MHLGLLLATALAATPGEEAPDFALTDTAGQEVSLSALRGQVVLLDSWASWCAPCKEELPVLEALQAQYQEQGLVVLAVSVDDRVKNRDRFLDKYPLALRVLDDSGQQVVAAYEVKAMPTTVLIDSEGVVKAVHLGYTQAEGEALAAEVAAAL